MNTTYSLQQAQFQILSEDSNMIVVACAARFRSICFPLHLLKCLKPNKYSLNTKELFAKLLGSLSAVNSIRLHFSAVAAAFIRLMVSSVVHKLLAMKR
jgi:hypothetical protein